MSTPVPVFFRFQLKWQASQGGCWGGCDDTALDMIKLICDDGTMIYGKPSPYYDFNYNYDYFGHWGQIFSCPSGQYYDAAEFR